MSVARILTGGKAAATIEYAILKGATRFRAAVCCERPEHVTVDSTVKVLTVVGAADNEDPRSLLPVEIMARLYGLAGIDCNFIVPIGSSGI